MRASTLPPVRVDEDLLVVAEGLLVEGESLSSFIETTVRRAVECRRVQAEFHARGQASWEHYKQPGISHATEDVVSRLQKKLDARRKQVLG